MFSRAAISFSAEATSSACWRLSSWQGPAMIEIGRSLPNLTVPMVTTGAADVEELKANPSFRRDHSRHQGRINPIRPGPLEYQGCAGGPGAPCDGSCYLTDENAVGVRIWLTMLPTIWPSASLSARAFIQSGSLMKPAHFFSRSASDSQARK